MAEDIEIAISIIPPSVPIISSMKNIFSGGWVRNSISSKWIPLQLFNLITIPAISIEVKVPAKVPIMAEAVFLFFPDTINKEAIIKSILPIIESIAKS